MSRLRRDGTTEPVSRDQILRRERGQGNIRFPCSSDLKENGNLTRLILTLAICVTIHTYIISRIIWGGGAQTFCTVRVLVVYGTFNPP